MSRDTAIRTALLSALVICFIGMWLAWIQWGPARPPQKKIVNHFPKIAPEIADEITVSINGKTSKFENLEVPTDGTLRFDGEIQADRSTWFDGSIKLNMKKYKNRHEQWTQDYHDKVIPHRRSSVTVRFVRWTLNGEVTEEIEHCKRFWNESDCIEFHGQIRPPAKLGTYELRVVLSEKEGARSDRYDPKYVLFRSLIEVVKPENNVELTP